MNFVFHHSGYDTRLPALLVQSIIKTNPNSTIIQISDKQTRRVRDVTEHIQFETTELVLSKQRCEMYAKLDITVPSVYLDTDMLVIKSITEEIFAVSDVVLCKRFWDGMIHSDDPADTMYAFKNQSLKEVWPYLACFVAAGTSEFWKEVFSTVQTLPWEKSDWFADQHALKILASNNASIANISEKQYACLPDQEYADPSILHFKGSRKNIMEKYYHNILC